MRLDLGELDASEADAAVELWREAGLLRPWNDPRSDIRLALENPSSTVLAGRKEGRLVATAMVGFDGHRGWIYYLAVRPDAARQGLGRRMVRAAEAWLKTRGAPKLNLMIRTDNAGVIGFYEKLGYRVGEIAVLQRVLE